MTKVKSNQMASIVVWVLFVLITYFISLQNYLLFHALVEGLSIFISFTVFIIAWNSRSYLEDSYLLILGIAYFFIGFLDFMHTLSYKGMSIFTEYAYYANQLWIAARFFESIVILVGLFFVGKKFVIKSYALLNLYLIVTVGILISIFFTDLFPVCFVEGEGQTTFKIVSEYVIIGILGLAILLVKQKRSLFEINIYRLLMISIIMTMLSELAFTFYISNYGFSNLVGHYFKIISFYCIYQAIVVTGIKEPYALIFRELSEANKEMKKLNGLLKESIEENHKANQSKSKYLSVISHEMRTPLNGILGFAQMIKRSKPTPELGEYTDEIIYSANILRQSIDNILDIEKYRTNKMQYLEEEIILSHFFENRRLFYKVLAEEKGLTFESKMNISKGIKVIVDSGKLEQLFNNLISNAVKFTDKGIITLEVNEELFEQKIRLNFKVSDTGNGIKEEEQKLLFEPFVQVGNLKRTKYGGSGLGLSICKEIVTHYKGAIEVNSRLGHGSKFIGKLVLDVIVERGELDV